MPINKKQYLAIQRLLRSSENRVSANSLWRGICDHYDIGLEGGRFIQISNEDQERLRSEIRRETRLDPMHDEVVGDRLQMADRSVNEKLSGESVFGEFLLVARSQGKNIATINGDTKTPEGTLAAIPNNALVEEDIKTLILVENGALVANWHRWADKLSANDAYILYRGHGNNEKHIYSMVERIRNNTKLIYFPDFDPSGVSVGFSYLPDEIVVPANWQSYRQGNPFYDKFNNRMKAVSQSMKCEESLMSLGGQIGNIIDHILKHRIAIMQEHLIVHDQKLVQVSIN